MPGTDDLDIELTGGEPDENLHVQGETAPATSDSTEKTLDLDLKDDFYSRYRLIHWWDIDVLRRAKVLVVGAGALGNEIVKNLALLGIGNILVVDMDTIENSNLSRSVLFRRVDEGRYKAEVISESAMDINPDITAVPLVGNIINDVGLGTFRAFDLVIGGLDNREARLHINQNCWKVNRPWIDGAIEVVSGYARVFVPPDSACYECTMNEMDYKLLSLRKSCSLLKREEMLEGKVPTTPTTSSVIAGIQCQEALKLLHDREDLPVLKGKGFFFNGMTHDSFVVVYDRREDCYSHVTYEDIREMPEWKASSTTVGEVLAHIRTDLGDEAVLDLERELVESLECNHCNTIEYVYAQLGEISEQDAKCPKCGEERHANLTHSLEGNDRYNNRTLSEMGVPPFDIVTGRAGFEMVHYELTGDREGMVGWLDAKQAVAAGEGGGE